MRILADVHPFCNVLVSRDASVVKAWVAHDELEEGGQGGRGIRGEEWEGLGAKEVNEGGESIF